MTGIATEEVAAVAPRPADGDLCREVERSVERGPNDRVRAVRVFDDFYRCNWWVPDAGPRLFWLPTATVRKSRFLRATRTADGLLVEDVTLGERGERPRPLDSQRLQCAGAMATPPKH